MPWKCCCLNWRTHETRTQKQKCKQLYNKFVYDGASHSRHKIIVGNKTKNESFIKRRSSYLPTTLSDSGNLRSQPGDICARARSSIPSNNLTLVCVYNGSSWECVASSHRRRPIKRCLADNIQSQCGWMLTNIDRLHNRHTQNIVQLCEQVSGIACAYTHWPDHVVVQLLISFASIRHPLLAQCISLVSQQDILHRNSRKKNETNRTKYVAFNCWCLRCCICGWFRCRSRR